MAGLIYLLLKLASWKWVLTAAIVIVAGSLIGRSVLWVAVDLLNAFGGPLAEGVYFWVPATFAAILLASANLWDSRVRRKVIAAICVVLFAIVGTLGVNAAYGLQTTIGQVLHISTGKPIDIPRLDGSSGPDPSSPLYQSWTPPRGKHAHGRPSRPVAENPEPNSGWAAPEGEIYLLPAALVPNPPRLPLMVIMMGQPGDPEATSMSKILDEFAAKNRGLAPIVVAVDQLGDPLKDPLCLDTPMGKSRPTS